MRELESLLPNLDPPAGGLARLQRYVAAHPRARPPLRIRWALAVAACVPLVVVAVWLPQWVAHRQQVDALVSALRENLAPTPAEGIRVAHGAAIELPSGQANVRLYLVQSAPPVAGDGQ